MMESYTAMVDRRLIDYNIARLKDKNPEVRMRSIEELRLLGDESAMPALEEVFRTDDDAEIRRAAQKAGVEIYRKNHPDIKLPG